VDGGRREKVEEGEDLEKGGETRVWACCRGEDEDAVFGMWVGEESCCAGGIWRKLGRLGGLE